MIEYIPKANTKFQEIEDLEEGEPLVLTKALLFANTRCRIDTENDCTTEHYDGHKHYRRKLMFSYCETYNIFAECCGDEVLSPIIWTLKYYDYEFTNYGEKPNSVQMQNYITLLNKTMHYQNGTLQIEDTFDIMVVDEVKDYPKSPVSVKKQTQENVKRLKNNGVIKTRK